MDHLPIWLFALDLKRKKVKTVRHPKQVPHYDQWCTTEEAEVALELLFLMAHEHNFLPADTTGGVTISFVLRPDGFHVKRVEVLSWRPHKTRVSYKPADNTRSVLNFEELKRNVVAEIREKVDKYVTAEITTLLLKQYKDRDKYFDELFGTQNL